MLREDGVDDGTGAFTHVVDEQALLHADLVGGQPHARGVVHGLEHVVGQLAQGGVELGDVRAREAQHGIAEHADGIHGHAPRE